jgi:hypothetical protein
MVHFPGFARSQLWIHWDVHRFYLCGFPHSEIPGSMPACGSPRLIAACHVLHRLLLPRHPPCALSSLTIKFTRHTAASLPAFSYQLSAISKPTTHRANSMGLSACSSHGITASHPEFLCSRRTRNSKSETRNSSAHQQASL